MVLSGVVLSGSAKIEDKSAAVKLMFDFGSGKLAPGYTPVRVNEVYSKETGYGFEPGSAVQEIDRGGDALTGDFATSDSFFRFSVSLP